MADFDSSRTTGTKNGKDHKAILAKARADYSSAYDREQNNIAQAYEDLEFLSGDGYSQWPDKQLRDREGEGRPTLQINVLPQFVHQITGDIRQMKPAIKVVAVDEEADEKVADVLSGLMRYIENRSDASAIYFRAADSQVACGIGHWRVTTEYADNSSFNQELRIAPIEDGVGVLWDPDSVLPDRSDAMFCFVPVDMSRAGFKAKYPDQSPTDFDDPQWQHNSSWVAEDHVRVAEYWVKEPTTKLLSMGADGSITDLTDADASVVAFHKSMGARVEERPSTKVVRYLLTASAVIEGPKDWIGNDIPIVPVVGEEVRIGRKIVRKGIVRDAKDPQRMNNYFHSAHTETVALQPKAPFMVTETNVAKYQDLWEQANTKNLPYLVYDPDTHNGGAAPQRVAPPVSSQGVLDGLQMAQMDLKAVIGIYDAGLGAKSNETSGKAIIARQREGDVGSYLYIDNFARAVKRTGSILVDLIPKVYDAERTIRVMGEDGRIDVLEINKAKGLGSDGKTLFANDLTIGTYDVVTQIGPSYSTRREEAKEGMVALLQAVPNIAPVVMDLVAKAQDWPMADDIAKRIRATMPPQVLAMEEAEKQGLDPQQAMQAMQQQNAPPPDPALVKAQADAEHNVRKLQLEEAALMIEREKIAAAAQQAEADRQAKTEIEMARIEADARARIAVARIMADAKAHDSEVRAYAAREAAEHRNDAARDMDS